MVPTLLCRSATPFTSAGELDEGALRALLRRLAGAKAGVCLGNPGAGEGHALTLRELARIYAIGVEVCRGKVPVYANPPEQPTARDTREHLAVAADAGVDAIVLYGPAGRHGYKPTDGELTDYFDNVLTAVKHPVALSADQTTGYVAKAEIIARTCEKYAQVSAVHIGEPGEDYLLGLKGLLKREVELCVVSPGSLRALAVGATGMLSAEANVIPQTCRRYVEAVAGGDAAQADQLYLQLKKFSGYVAKWGPVHARWIKMCMRLFGLPGGAGGVREPYLFPPPADCEKFAAGLLQLGIAEIDDLARAANLRRS